MEENLIKLASSQGVWAALSIILIFYILKMQEKRDFKQEEREKSYQEIISSLTNKLVILEDIKTNIDKIKETINIK